MPTPIESQILEVLRRQSGQTAAEVAEKLGCTRKEVNRLLHGELRNQLRQDTSYRWYLAASGAGGRDQSTQQSEQGLSLSDTDLARLTRYYLSCIGYDGTGVSAFLNSQYNDLDYAELHALPRTSVNISDYPAARQLLGRTRTQRASYGLYLGYPCNLVNIRSRRGNWSGLVLQPILLFPLEQEGGSGRLSIDFRFPLFNPQSFKSLSHAENDTVMNEIASIEQQLGLIEEQEPPQFDELVMRLHALRPEWPWKEQIDPDDLSATNGPIGETSTPGIYNRAVLIAAERSPFTQGLEQELRELGRLPEGQVRNSALGNWLYRDSDSGTAGAQLPLLEVLPLNLEQRQAVQSALTRKLTVITGPPGTGKSQVVANILINAAWLGKRVLFASKNNKAVDVVETRVNNLGPRPILLRVGAQAYQIRLAEYVLALMAATVSQQEKAEFDDSRRVHHELLEERKCLGEESALLVSLRNEVDDLERKVEGLRRELPSRLFHRASELDFSAIEQVVSDVHVAADAADRRKAPLFVRMVWKFVRRRRETLLSARVADLCLGLEKLDVKVKLDSSSSANVDQIRDVCNSVDDLLKGCRLVARYFERLRSLQNSRSLEEIARQDLSIADRIARNSAHLWRLWLRLQPAELTANDRRRLGQYSAIIQMVIDAGTLDGLPQGVARQYRQLFRDTAHLLPCWAVTSLSAHRRVQFEPGFFDIVVFDEASQCDIASALPLLYRAKSVVVIGDPKQLSHISGLPRGQDLSLLEKHGLMRNFSEWAYSYQSLFGLAATIVRGEDIVSLVDHHRSHSDIINFSNQEFYERRLRVATRYDRLRKPGRDEPGVRWLDVRGSASRPASGGAVNMMEVNHVVGALRELVIARGYKGTVGVVSPFRAQANAIVEAVNADRELSTALTNADFLADTVHRFQGDERDVMIFSPVLAPSLPEGALSFLRNNPNLFNVAITRARAQLIVVGDRTACLSSGVGYLSRFAEYTARIDAAEHEALEEHVREFGEDYPTVTRPELVSDWERIFYRALFKAGERPIPQYPVEKYLLDFLIVEGERRLAIEIDGERYHRSWTGELCRRDQIRNQRLFELGYDVIRFWVYEVRDDIGSCIERVRAWKQRES